MMLKLSRWVFKYLSTKAYTSYKLVLTKKMIILKLLIYKLFSKILNEQDGY
jgi:competence protein ComGF